MGALLVPVTASTHLLQRWVTRAGRGQLAFWYGWWLGIGFRPDPQSRFTRWLILILSLAMLIFLLATLLPDMF